MGLLVKLILFVIKDPFLLRCETILLETLFHNHFPPQIVMLAKKNFTIFTNERVGYWCCSLITGNIYLQLIAVWLFSLQYFYFLILCLELLFCIKSKIYFWVICNSSVVHYLSIWILLSFISNFLTSLWSLWIVAILVRFLYCLPNGRFLHQHFCNTCCQNALLWLHFACD